jgi:hypothetical protein
MTGAPVAAKEATVTMALPEAGIEPDRFRAAMPRSGVYIAEGVVVPRAGRWRLQARPAGGRLHELVVGEHDHNAADHHHDASEIR